MEPRYLTLLEAAEYLRVTERWMRQRVAMKEIPFHKFGHLLRFTIADLDTYGKAARTEAIERERHQW